MIFIKSKEHYNTLTKTSNSKALNQDNCDETTQDAGKWGKRAAEIAQFKKEVGSKIRRERQIRDMTLTDLSKLANISAAFLGLIERGERGISIERLKLFADILGLTANDLLYNISFEQEPDEDYVLKSKKATLTALEKDLSEKQIDFLIDVARNLNELAQK